MLPRTKDGLSRPPQNGEEILNHAPGVNHEHGITTLDGVKAKARKGDKGKRKAKGKGRGKGKGKDHKGKGKGKGKGQGKSKGNGKGKSKSGAASGEQGGKWNGGRYRQRRGQW